MTEEVRRLSRRRAAVDVGATLVGVAAIAGVVGPGGRDLLVVGAYSLLVGTSTGVVTLCLTEFTGTGIPDTAGAEAEQAETAGDEPPSSGLVAGAWQTFTGSALETEADVEEDTGWLIGRLENVIVLTLVLTGEYTALSIIFAAKSWVRREDIASGNTTYYLAGTLVNFTYSIIVGLVTLRFLTVV